MNRLENKVALITGGANGMGASHVKRFVAEGAKVYFTDLSEEAGKNLQKEIGEQTVFIRQDVSSETDWKAVMETIGKTDGKLDILLNNAGIAPSGLIEELSLEEYIKVININQVSIFLSLKYGLPLLKKSGSASVINISSIAGLKGISAGNAAYSSSKYAVRGLTQVAAIEFAAFNIRVNSIHPGFVKTPMLDAVPADVLEQMIKSIPLNRLAVSEELSNVILFLAGDEASYCTAGEYVVDGGLMAR